MISMLDRDYSGKMGFNEFKELWGALNQWKVSNGQCNNTLCKFVKPPPIIIYENRIAKAEIA